MIAWLKRHLLPHDGNAYRPRLLHGESARTVVIMVLAFELFAFILPGISFYEQAKQNMAAVLPAVLATLTNEERKDQRLGALAVNPLLTRAAELKAQDMATKGYFAHTSPEGRTPWYWLRTAGYDYQYAGENLAINFTDSKDVTAAWMNSPGHRANIVKGVYTDVGTGVAVGMYEGRETVFVAQVYASPVVREILPPAPVPADDVPAPVAAAPVEAAGNVLGAEVQPGADAASAVTHDVTALERAATSPRHAVNGVLIALAVLVGTVVVLTVVIKVNVQHPDLVTNGLAVVAVIAAFVIGNTMIARSDIRTLQTEYSFVPETTNQW